MVTVLLPILFFVLGILAHKLWMYMHLDGVLEIDHSNPRHDTVHIQIDKHNLTKKKIVILEVKDNAIISQEEQGLL